MRDNFPRKIIETIRKRAGYICSNPDCRALTIAGAEHDDLKLQCIGIVAHIKAASPNGPRADLEITKDERRSIENGIYLCANCSNMIDKNNGKDFPGNLLKKWKKEHEEWIRTQLNKKIDNNRVKVTSNNQRNGITANNVTIFGSSINITSEEKDRILFSYSENLMNREDILNFNRNIGTGRIYKISLSKMEAFTDGFSIPEYEYINVEIETAKRDLISHISNKIRAFQSNPYLIKVDCGDYFKISFRDKKLPKVQREGLAKITHTLLVALNLKFDPDSTRLDPWWYKRKKEDFLIEMDRYNNYRREIKRNLFI